MGLSCSFYNYAGNARQISKTLGSASATTGTCEPYNTTDSMNPSILCDYIAGVSGCNMAVVSDGNVSKTYFITSVSYTTGGKMIVNLHVDVLTTYGGAIKGCAAVAERTSNNGQINGYIPDAQQHHDSRQLIDVYDLGSFDYNNGSLVLMTAG